MICLFIELAKFWILTGKVDKISLFRITIKQNFRTKGKYQKFCEILLLLFQSTTKGIVDCENFFTFQAEKKCGETVIYSNYIYWIGILVKLDIIRYTKTTIRTTIGHI